MIKKELIIPFVAALLGIIFIFVSFLVWINRGKNSILLRQKLRLGSIILSLTAVASCSQPQVSCYEKPPLKDSEQINGKVTVKEEPIVPSLKKDSIKSRKPKPKDTGWQDIRKTCYMPVRRDTNDF